MTRSMDVDTERLRNHIARLAVTPRPAESPQLEQAREYVSDCLQRSGWSVERSEFQATSEEGVLLRGVNLIACHGDHGPGGGPRLCLGAHLDSRPDSPGADDNASAVAALLEVARVFPARRPAEPKLDLELVVFDLEENGMLGGAERARQMQEHGVDLRGMVSLEMLGYRDPRPQSQMLPRSLVGQYPDTGDFIAVIGNQNSETLLERVSSGMRRVVGLPVETLAVPANGEYLQATRLSDHSPFWDAGYPALMITDTSFLRNPHYHLPSDTLETLDLEFLTHVTQGCLEAVAEIVSRGLKGR